MDPRNEDVLTKWRHYFCTLEIVKMLFWNKRHRWSSLFIEVSLRALRRIHLEYCAYGVGRQWLMNHEKTRWMNTGPGFELASEVSVCSALVQEFRTSPIMSSWWEENKEQMYFHVEQEKVYEFDTKRRADLFIQKTRVPQMTIFEPPSLIEAKRARLWKPGNDKRAYVSGRSQEKDVDEDIVKLAREIIFQKDRGKNILGHVIVWGTYKKNESAHKHPQKFLDGLVHKNSIRISELRWSPLDWNHRRKSFAKPSVTKFLWVVLAEVTKAKRILENQTKQDLGR